MVFVAVHIVALVALATQCSLNRNLIHCIIATDAPAPELVTLVAPFPHSDTAVTFTASTVAFLGGDGSGASSTIALPTGTLVERSDYVSYTFAVSADGFTVTAEAEFGLQGGNAVATGLDPSSRTVTTTVPAASFGSQFEFSAENDGGGVRDGGRSGSGMAVGLNISRSSG
ncbi:hypothetical protein FB451DRAFT_1181341 [Mycena latifolia]|nr:hypothetical protein FB451DRAFT_1181341 [Mycena latifolia]